MGTEEGLWGSPGMAPGAPALHRPVSTSGSVAVAWPLGACLNTNLQAQQEAAELVLCARCCTVLVSYSDRVPLAFAVSSKLDLPARLVR